MSRAGRGPFVLDPEAIRAGDDELGIGDGDAAGGTYSLVYELDEAARIDVGALGDCAFPAGAYAYVGSAHGSNGLGRVARHRRVASGDHDVRHWHVDYLGGHPESTLVAVVASPNADIECRVARRLRSSNASPSAGEREPLSVPVPRFGSSDCDCTAHLASGTDAETVLSAVVESFEGKE